MLQQCHALNRFLQEWGCSCRHRCQQEHSRRLLSTATWTLPSRLDMRSFSYLTIRARDGALLFRVSDIFHCYSGGCSQSLVRDTPVPMQCVFIAIWEMAPRIVPNQFTARDRSIPDAHPDAGPAANDTFAPIL